jgi:hypothetical protein
MLSTVISVLTICHGNHASSSARRCSFYGGNPERIHRTGQAKEPWNCFYTLLPAQLISKPVVPELLKVLDETNRMVNYIKSRPLQWRLFSALCSAMEAAHAQLLLQMEGRWLSRGQVLSRFYELREELIIRFYV